MEIHHNKARGHRKGKAILISAAITVLSAGHASEKNEINEILKPIEQMRIKADIPGLAIATFTSQGQQFTYTSGKTSKDPSGKSISTGSTLFPIASVSKLFRTVSIFQLIQKGKFTLDTSLSELKQTSFYRLVKNRCPAKMLMLEKILVRHLLSHQGGINQDTPGANLWWDVNAIADGMYPSQNDFNEGFCSLDQLLEPGTAPLYKYSNTGFNLLAEIVASYGGEDSFEQYVQKNILSPLNMENTFYSLTAEQAKNQLVISYGNLGTDLTFGEKGRLGLPKVLLPLTYEGSIGINSTAEDLEPILKPINTALRLGLYFS
jgi:CubicO group peptidase (beta-lactamase class C family)